MKRLLFLLFLLGCTIPALADYPLAIIELKGRTVEEMIPILRPLVEPDGTVTGMQNQLIIRAAPEKVAEIRQLLEKLDHPPRQLMIYVRQGAAESTSDTQLQADVNAMAGKDTKVIIGQQGPEGVRVYARSAGTRSDLNATQQIRTVEGKPAFIASGQSIPIQEQTTYVGSGVVQQQITTTYHDATTGFYVVPRLVGDRVTLEISPHMERPGGRYGEYEIQQAHTVVSGRLGEWITVGGTTRTGGSEQSDITRSASTRGYQDRTIQLLVEEIQ
jgi:type II secretory pathway component GspD/PulD (secretin)